ncbi:hypothetical protein BX600DRAFT_515881 [Xylariales sp. PMI_506]|nr:hypothetical protein BX600DRAFT_515881 [Xylariales sp. PMI_506]
MLESEFISLCRSIWPNLPTEQYSHSNYASALEFFELEARGLLSQQKDPRRTGLRQLTSLINHLSQHADVFDSRDVAIVQVRACIESATNDAVAHYWLDLAVRAMFTIDVRSIIPASRLYSSSSPSTTIRWDQGLSLTEAINTFFGSNRAMSHKPENCRILPSMSIPYLCKYRSYKVAWTSNLAEHLNINWRFKVITVYEHKVFLYNHLKNAQDPITPRAVLEEAIDTLNLLFPLNDPLTKRFLDRCGKTFHGLGYCGRPRAQCLDLGKFVVWQTNIARLMEIMDEQPTGLRQLALETDGSNLLPFLAFWVAIAVAILTILGLPFSIVSMYYAMKQYQLALAQACSEPGSAANLAQFCA